MNRLLLGVVLCSVVVAAMAQSQQCQTGEAQCAQTFIANAPTFTDKDKACAGVATFLDCTKAACGEIPSQVMDTIKQTLAGLGFQCDNLPGNSAAAAGVSLLLLPAMAVVAAIVRRM